ncbi:hypothetical protein BV20DRAFT_937742 [Pilatotrama ljubarskyi]|nr:hypothetical protein BV20DRAFT_937742 [Pilatotrama ljubarskyi]
MTPGDEPNPFYCPSLPAALFLQELHTRLSSQPWSFSSVGPEDHGLCDDPSVSFYFRLCEGLSSDDNEKYNLARLSASALKKTRAATVDSIALARLWNPDNTPHEFSRSFSSSGGLGLSLYPEDNLAHSQRSIPNESGSFSAFREPPQRGRSPISLNDDSFALSGKADRLRFSYRHQLVSPNVSGARVFPKSSSEEEPFHWLGPETPTSLALLLLRLERALPGLPIQQRLRDGFLAPTHQHILDIIAAQGRLTVQVLNLFSRSEVECLDLTSSMMDEGGLNLGAPDLLRTLSNPEVFLFVQELNLSGVNVEDADVLSFNRLPRLCRLWLSRAGIGNEAVYHLVALKRSLRELDVSHNLRIDDDAVPALLLLLRRLEFLSLVETSVSIAGMRRLALLAHFLSSASGRTTQLLQVEAPRTVEDYIDELDSKYLLDPAPPLVIDADAVPQLSVAALRRNLGGHAACNPSIVVGGTKGEMAERLSGILRCREGDLAVRALLGEE